MTEIVSRPKKVNFIDIGLIAIAATIPFGFSLNNIAIIFTFLASIKFFSLKNIVEQSRTNIVFNIFYIYLFFNLLSLCYSSNLDYGFSVISRLTYFLIIPILIINTKFRFNNNFVAKLFRYYIFSCLLACLIYLVVAAINTFEYANVNPFNKNNGNFFSYIQFTLVIKKHPIYFGTNILFAMAIIFYSLLYREFDLKISTKAKISVTIFFTFIVFLLNSFMLIIIYFVIIILFLYKAIANNLLKTTKLQLSMGLVVIMTTIALSSSFILQKSNGVHLINDLTTRDYSGNDFTAVKARNAKIYCSLQVIKNNFIFGVGAGDCPDELLKQYLLNKFQHGYERKFNSHNQFLTTFISTGIIGFTLLIAMLIVLIKIAIKQKNLLLLIFVFINTLFFLSESVLERQQGIVFFVFFSAFLVVIKSNILENE